MKESGHDRSSPFSTRVYIEKKELISVNDIQKPNPIPIHGLKGILIRHLRHGTAPNLNFSPSDERVDIW